MSDPTKEQMDKFLIGLEKLSRETGVVIYSADRVYTIEEAGSEPESGYSAELPDDEIGWVSPSDNYDWEKYSHLIVKDGNQ